MAAIHRPSLRALLGLFTLSTLLAMGSTLGVSAAGNNAPDTVLPYRDASLSVDERIDDLLQRMTLEEKAGQMFHSQLNMGPNGTLDTGAPGTGRNSTDFMLGTQMLTHFNLIGEILDARQTAQFVNRVQQHILDTTPLGIPLTLSTDPRHAFTENIGTGFPRGPLLAVARAEYRAVGIRAALHPQVDLTTEPRWARIGGTFGEDADLTAEMLSAYILGLQGETFGADSITTVTKHFPGGGPMENGEDSHFAYGKNQTYPGKNLEYHLIPFKAAIAVGARQMMPYYSRPIGLAEYDPVGFGFNKGIVTGLLREELGFEGIVVTDWGLITDAQILGQDMPARAWGSST
ncbi:hypothetical protein PG984_002509 [Apiospora sp. TS-2023a]